MGCGTGLVRDFAFCVRSGLVCALSGRSVVGIALPGTHLLDQYLLEHQRDLPQLHTQPVFQLAPIESDVRGAGIDDAGILANILQVCASSASHGEQRQAG